MNYLFYSLLTLFFYFFHFALSNKLRIRKLSENIITFTAGKGTIYLGPSKTFATSSVKSYTVNGESGGTITTYTFKTVKDENEIVIYYNDLIDCSSLLFKNNLITYVDLSQFDSSSCSSMANFFNKCSKLTSIKLGDNYDTSNVHTMNSMFNGCSKLTSIDICKFDTSKVTDMSSMFLDSGIVYLDMTCLNTASVTTMNQLFCNCKSLLSVDLSNLQTSKVTDIGSMFQGCSSIISVQLYNFDTSSLENANNVITGVSKDAKVCIDTSNELLRSKVASAGIALSCEDDCFLRSKNKFDVSAFTCYESCTDSTDKKWEFNSQCYSICPSDIAIESPTVAFLCIPKLICSKGYYNVDKTECIDTIPDGYYCDDLTERTTAKCSDDCKTCDLDSQKNKLCLTCNTDDQYYEIESDNDKYKNCTNIALEGYYFEDSKYKKCYEKCKYCSSLGDESEQKCTECYSNNILELGSNCYPECSKYYYFDDSNTYQCADETCPTDYNLISQKNKCVKDCRTESPYIYQYEGKCLDECPSGYHAPEEDKLCVLALHCDNYYNYAYDDCLDEVPKGFYCNDTVARTIDMCDMKCRECTLESTNAKLCTKCNKETGYYEKEGDVLNYDNFVHCYNTLPEKYYLSLEDDMYKKCFRKCKYCTALGNIEEQLCSSCYDGFTLNGTNCYEICDFHYYFDDNKEYKCTKDDNCPSGKTKLIVEKDECVQECVGEFRFEFDNKCYRACPTGSYYNYEQTNCIASVPVGYYLNDTQTIDKCDIKCETCIKDSVDNSICVSCSNSLDYFQKEDDNSNPDGFIDCFKGAQDGYYLDRENKEYKLCYKKCKSCNEKGNVEENKCTECYDDYTLNKTNCFEICPYYHYFDDIKDYHCTGEKKCPDIRSKLVFDTYECILECNDEYNYEFNNTCYKACPPGTYYDYTHTGCIDSIPLGYYLNDTKERTIEKCDNKCKDECFLDFSNNKVLCKECNNLENYYKKENDVIKDNYYDCYIGKMESYFIDLENNEYKKCYEKCKNCDKLGTILEHNCNECFNKFTLNGTNCYEICDYFYYFDSDNIYRCSDENNCPSEFPFKIIEKKSCIKNCSEEEIFKYPLKDRCYDICPKYYNYEHTACIDEIPEGFYLNDTEAKTIDKCDEKCSNCDQKSAQLNLCISCNNLDNYYKKENDELNKDGYINCYYQNTTFEGYYLNLNTKSYSPCFEKCKYCIELGIITNHKCTECYKDFTLNGTNCYEICDYHYYFDLNTIYHCTENKNCPPAFPYEIKQKKQCVKKCSDDDTYKYTHFDNNICYDECPVKTKISQNDPYFCEIKCEEKCLKCDKKSDQLNLCISCNNIENYYIKENDESNKDGYINCYYQNTTFEGYYLNLNTKSYSPCFEKCKYCSELGIITNHKCTECYQNFTLNGTNCYEICDYYHYFDSNKIYHCTESRKCPRKYFLIPEKNECIDNCTHDDEYIFEHKGICLNQAYIPNCTNESMFIINSGECAEECTSKDFMEKRCKLRNNIPVNQDSVMSMLRTSLVNGELEENIQDLNDELETYIIFEEDITYQLMTYKSSSLYETNNVSDINLGNCENILKDKYNIPNDLTLIILKIDYYRNDSLIPIVGYDVYHPLTKEKLDLSICNKNEISITYPTNIDKEKEYLYDPNSDFYNDECHPYTTEKDTDIILSDRIIEYNTKNLSICENGCTFKSYNESVQKSVCICGIKNNELIISGLGDNLFTKISENKESNSVNSMKCIKTLFTKDSILKNVAFYIYLVLLIAFIFITIQFYRKGYSTLIGHINKILSLKEKKTEEELNRKESVDEYFSDKKSEKDTEKVLRLRTPKNFKHIFKGQIAKDDIIMQDNYSNNQKSITILNFRKLREYNESQTKNNRLETESDVNYTDFEINSFTYKQAIGVDLRPFKKIYISFIKYKHPFIFAFTNSSEYNSPLVKFALLIISFSLYYFVNSLFLTKSTVHDIYIKENINDIKPYIPYIFISFIICYTFEQIIKYLSLSDSNITSVSNESLYNNAKIKGQKMKKFLLIKYILFFSLGIISIILFGYYLSTFGAVYQNTQFVLVKNALISYLISLIFPFMINIIPAALRRYSLKDATRQCIFNLSRYLQVI